MKPHALALIPLSKPMQAALDARYHLHVFEQGLDSVEWQREGLAEVEIVVTNGSNGLNAAAMARMPKLKVISAVGAGYENVDVAEATRRKVFVAHGPGTNSASVAEHAIGFALSLARGYGVLQQGLKAGKWAELRQSRPSFSGSRVGILGLGQIGHMIATRARAFGANIGYHTPKPKPDLAGPLAATYYPDVISLARNSDFLFAACPGGPATRHLLDTAAFEALGPKAYVINVARGSVLKTADLLAALKNGTIAGAALDVLEEEPAPPPELLAELASFENLLITPHMSGRSPASVIAQRDVMLENIEAGMAGKIPPYQVAAQRNAT